MTPSELQARLTRSRGILFDLDNTLYPRERGVFDRIRERISEFVADLTGLGPTEVLSLRREYMARYGTTLGGLMAREKVDPEEFMEFVHDIPVEEMLSPDPELGSFLGSIELPMAVLTNASLRHAERVLEILGIERFFQGICDLEKTGFLGKPHREAYDVAAGMLSLSLSETVFLDDVPEYVAAGSRFGALTIYVGPPGNGTGHFHVNQVTDLAGDFREMPWFNSKVSR